MRRASGLVLLAACSFSLTAAPNIDASRDDIGPGDAVRELDATSDGPVDAAPDASPTCPSNYLSRDGSAYRFVSTATTWLAAEQDCENDGYGTHLVVVGSSGELVTVDAISTASLTWLGASDRVTAGIWLWVTGLAAPYTETSPGRCAEWYDGTGGGTPREQTSGCTGTTMSYLCECDLVPANPATY